MSISRAHRDDADLYTIGHSNRSIEEFTLLLQAHGIAQVVDVRTAAGSRRNPQFMLDCSHACATVVGEEELHHDLWK